MAETPDLERVISVIMENPSLIAQISSLVSGKGQEKSREPQAKSEPEPDTAPTVSTPSQSTGTDGRRNKLLYAMKPYLSVKRQSAMDTVITVLDVLHTVRGR